MGTATIDRADIQGLIVRGHGTLRAARYVLARIAQPAGARTWLSRIADDVDDGRDRPGQSAVNVALTASGLRKLGLPAETLGMFSREFTGGMTAEHRRRILGDVDESAPEHWSWGGPNGEEIDVLLLLYAADEAGMSALLDAHTTGLTRGGLVVIRTLDTSPLVDHEHFGFRDGVSQPRIEELGEAPDLHAVKAGEFILGYRNGYGQFTPRPLLDAQADPDEILPRADDAPGKTRPRPRRQLPRAASAEPGRACLLGILRPRDQAARRQRQPRRARAARQQDDGPLAERGAARAGAGDRPPRAR